MHLDERHLYKQHCMSYVYDRQVCHQCASGELSRLEILKRCMKSAQMMHDNYS